MFDSAYQTARCSNVAYFGWSLHTRSFQYKFLEEQLTTKQRRLRTQIVDIKATLGILGHLKSKMGDEGGFATEFRLSDALFARAQIPKTDKVRGVLRHFRKAVLRFSTPSCGHSSRPFSGSVGWSVGGTQRWASGKSDSDYLTVTHLDIKLFKVPCFFEYSGPCRLLLHQHQSVVAACENVPGLAALQGCLRK